MQIEKTATEKNSTVSIYNTGSRVAPVKVWAVTGAVMLLFILYVWGKWIFGPNFTPVPVGPSEPPMWMKVCLNIFQVAMVILAIFVVNKYVVQPWRRNRYIGFDGMVVLASPFLWFQDGLSAYLNNHFTYNSYLINFGSWYKDVPGWLPHAEPGAMIVEPLCWGPLWVVLPVGVSILGCWFLRKVKERFPNIRIVGLIFSLFIFMCVVDFIGEGFGWMPLGVVTYIGGGSGEFTVFPEAYHRFPIHEAIFVSLFFCGLALLRYFRNDKGEMLAERGISDLNISNGQKHWLRFLAMFSITQLFVLLCFNVWVAIIVAHPMEFNEDWQSRSYFTNGLCGDGTDYACPSSKLPNPNGPGATHVGPNGEIYGPDGDKIAPEGTVPGIKVVPHIRGETGGPFTGPVFGISR